MLLSALKGETLKKYFPISHCQRGHEYYHQGRVHYLKIVTNHNSTIEIDAHVRGGKPKSYNVKIYISGTTQKIHIRGICSCPMVINCKHTVAAILKALDQASSPECTLSTVSPCANTNTPSISQTAIAQESTLIRQQSSLTPQNQMIEPPHSQRDQRVDTWLRKLREGLISKKTPDNIIDETYSLHYVLYSLHHNLHELRLSLILVKRLKSGKLGSEKAFNHSIYSHQQFLLPIDKELHIKLEIAKKMESSFTHGDFLIRGAAFNKLLPELIATNRCHWLSPHNPPLCLTEPKKATLEWSMDEQGYQLLHFNFPQSNIPFGVFSIEQTWYLSPNTAQIGLLETGLEDHIVKLLLYAPKIPPESAKEVAHLLAQNDKYAAVARPKIFKHSKIEKLKPIFCLRLSQAALLKDLKFKNNCESIQVNLPIAALSFDYDGIEVPWDDTRKELRKVDDEYFSSFIRDEQCESDAFDMLNEHGLTLIHDIYQMNSYEENSKFLFHFLVESKYCNALDFSTKALPLLRKQGWRIEFDADYPYQIVDETIDDWYSSIDEDSSHDWFNLELGIILKGEKINLIPILQQLLKKVQLNNHSLDLSEIKPVLAQLPDGRFISLPMERVQNIINVLVELYDRTNLTDGNALRLFKLHAARLLELEAAMGAVQLRWNGGEKIKKLANKLVNSTGIKVIKIPKQFQGQLRPYQHEGLNWLQFLREYEFGGILADDMGLGKTVQALSHLSVEKMSGRMKIPSLIVAPTTLMFNWRMEAERFTPHLKVLVLHGADRKYQFENISHYDLVLTTYPLLKHDKEVLLKQAFYFLILDEAQNIKNSKSLSTHIVQQIQAQHRLCLTGTPLENHLGELWSLFHFMMPGLLGDEKIFNRVFRQPIEKHGDQNRRAHLSRRIAPFMLRRTKNNVVKELPEKVIMTRQIEIDGAQRDLYETIRVTMQKKIRQEISKLGLARSHIIILDALLKLRQACCDPRLLKIDRVKKNKARSAKLELLMTLLPELIEEGRRILLFSQFTEMLELIEHELNKQKIAYVKLTGQTKDRSTPVQQFQKGEISLFLISLKAGGTGLNLTAADTVIHYDPWWNPAVEDQATDRAHRIGQDKTVFVYKLVTKGTVEEKILDMQQNKRQLMEGLFSANTTGQLKLTEKDLQKFFEPLEALD